MENAIFMNIIEIQSNIQKPLDLVDLVNHSMSRFL